ncbi:MAG: protoporphyrinogen oxidase [Kineosporiaceae bacterium]
MPSATPAPRRPSVIVAGGGIAGLSTAYALRGRADVTVLEASPRWGGKIHTVGMLDPLEESRAWPVDTGPDSLLIRHPAVRGLVADLGLVPDVVAPAIRGSYLWLDGVLRPMPAGSLFGVPDRLLPLLRNRVVGPWGMLRAAADLVLPRRALPADPSLAQLLRHRFGPAVFDRLIEPMLGGVHAGRATRLSAASTVPEVMRLLDGHRSVFLALRAAERRRASGASAAPSASASPSGAAAGPQAGASSASPAALPAAPLVTFRAGLSQLVEALLKALADAGAELLPETAAASVTRDGEGWRVAVRAADGLTVSRRADHVVLAVPAPVALPLLEGVDGLDPAVPAALAGIETVSVATVTLAFPRSAVPGELAATGFLVPPGAGRLLVGCSWLTSKWEHLRNDETVLFRCMVGRDGDQVFTDLDDETLVRAVTDELRQAVGARGEPAAALVRRWDGAMPQYTVGHRARLDALGAGLAPLPGLHVTGSSYRGVGVASCIVDGFATAAAIAAPQEQP